MNHTLNPSADRTGVSPTWPRIAGMPLPAFALMVVILLMAIYTDTLPAGMIGGLLVMMILGEALGFIGDRLPIVRTYLGGGAILAIFGAATLMYFPVMPGSVETTITDFMKDGGFLNFYIAALITGSILGMDPKALVQIGTRYFVPILGAVAGAVVLAALVGLLVGFSISDAVLVITLPILGGGMGAGAVPMSQVYEQLLGQSAGYYISLLVPALALGNVFAIVVASLLSKLGERYPHLTGNGQIMAGVELEENQSRLDIGAMGIGVMMALSFYVSGQLLGQLVPLHPYALMIILVAVFKISGLVPDTLSDAASQWYGFVARNWTFALLFGIGVAYTDLGTVLEALTPTYVMIVFAVVAGATLGAGLLGKVVGFYPIESAITAGLCMANMGGTGDVAVLSAARRMQLMPFAQISSRLGGALILLMAGTGIPLLL
ncbi:2-hydroxycarboxylate transporter family protein [Aidingimonas halophila]|uniref:Citrate carrier protein, CCS family n=1 Tax=Aidingimonas halophila TaxID=574349 RepID=A0A1H2V7A5_9GAMM|nr:2-hydroxycarboxylate transporter family protein [Aidingimonas halophila]GHC23893.1 citrate:sodium symporter [Aidingimonas halophila]SDW64218.1 citrate carrier protein, CCS family [Aidingimonas halophila]